tara:strand:- start:121 stop:312 length:192 start_codon:yes stop_codon:yes gene_type:complete
MSELEILKMKLNKIKENNKEYCKKYSKTVNGKIKNRRSSSVYYWKRIKKQYHIIYNPDPDLKI